MPFTNTAYGPVTKALMTSVFEQAWQEAQARGIATEAARDLMVSTILTAVDNGERLPSRLVDLAIRAVAAM